MRIAGLWVGSHDPNDPKKPSDAVLRQIRLNGQDTQLVNLNAPGQATVASVDGFSVYNPTVSLAAQYETEGPALGPNSQSEHLALFQCFSFTQYGKDPPHEPGAVLSAARIFPLLGFEFRSIDKDNKPVRYFRVDYRFNFALDQLAEAKTKWSFTLRDPPKNQGGLFRDEEGTPAPIQLDTHQIPFLRSAQLQDVFAAAEKPLQWEILTKGLEHGDALIDGKPATWDNYHQWATPYPGGFPTTPGAFHCLHMHWRWSKIVGVASSPLIPNFFKLLPAAGREQFKGLGLAGGPLLDPSVPDQTLRIAVTENFNTDLDSESLSEPNFYDLFKKKKKDPGPISNGSDLVLWLSVEAFRGQTLAPWKGTLLIHGCYFAHEPERNLWSGTKAAATAGLAGLNRGLLKPVPTRRWERYAV